MSNTILHDKCSAFEDKIKELEEKLAIAREALENLRSNYCFGNAQVYIDIEEALKEVGLK